MQKVIEVLNSKPYSRVKLIREQSFICFRVFEASGYFGGNWETSPNTQNHHQQDAESNLNPSTYHFKSNKALFKRNSYLKVKFRMFQGIWSITAIQQKLCPSHLISLEFSIFIISRFTCLNLLSKMGSINCSGQVVQDILQNKYLKTNFENLENRDFFPSFLNYIRVNFSKKNALIF